MAGGTTSGSGGTTSGSGGTMGGTGGTTGGTGGGVSGAGGTTSGTGGMASGAGGMTSGAGGTTSGAGGTTSGAGGSAGDGGSAAGGLSGNAGASAGGGGMAGAAGSSTRSAGCGKPLQRPDRRTQQTMQIGGTTRYYLLDVPAGTDNDTPLSLVFGVHGYDMNNVAVVDLFNFTSRSNGKAITVLPQGEGPPPGDTPHWGDHVLESTWAPNEANYTFIQELITDLKDRYCIDPNRVFVAGFSMGGMFTNSLACAHSDWFRGFAPVAGLLASNSCPNAEAKPAVIVQHGTADTIVTPNNGEATRDFWIEQNGCNQMTTPSFSGCQSFGGCAPGSPVVYCVGNYDHTITDTAAANIWSFFSGLD